MGSGGHNFLDIQAYKLHWPTSSFCGRLVKALFALLVKFKFFDAVLKLLYRSETLVAFFFIQTIKQSQKFIPKIQKVQHL